MLGVAEIDQRVEAVDGLEDDVAAFAAVAAVGPAIFDELFMAKAHRTGAAGARAHENLGGIKEMHGRKIAHMWRLATLVDGNQDGKSTMPCTRTGPAQGRLHKQST